MTNFNNRLDNQWREACRTQQIYAMMRQTGKTYEECAKIKADKDKKK